MKLKRFLQKGLKASWLIVFLPAYLFLILKPIVVVRFGQVKSMLVGHFGIDPVLFFIERKLSSKKIIDVYLENGVYTNKCLEYFFRTNDFLISPNLGKPLEFFFKNAARLPGLGFLWRPLVYENNSRDTKGLLNISDHPYRLNAEQLEKGKQLVGKMGWNGISKIVLFHVRSSHFHSTDRAIKDFYKENYSDPFPDQFRNSDISSYEDAMLSLCKKGYFVVRIGKGMDKPVGFSHPFFVDYSFSDFIDDWTDIWLCQNCDFIVSTASGIDVLGLVHQKPVLFINAMPLCAAWITSPNVMWVPKHLKKNGKLLSIKEMFDAKFYVTSGFLDAGLEIVDLNEGEIAAIVDEFESRVRGIWNISEEEYKIQNKIRSVFENSSNFFEYYGFFNEKFFFSMHWVQSNKAQLLDF